MKIAFDLRRIMNPGIGRYMRCLVEAVLRVGPQHEYVLIVPTDARAGLASLEQACKIVASDVKYYSVSEQIVLPRILKDNGVDLLHSPHFLLPLRRSCRAVVTIHDLIGWLCKDDLGSGVGRLYYGLMSFAAAHSANQIITDSLHSKRDICRHLHVKEDKVAVIHPGVSMIPEGSDSVRAEVRRKYNLAREFILYTAIYKPRKNHHILLHSLRLLADKGADVDLVLAGPLGAGEEELRSKALELGISNRLRFTGFVPESELRALYSAAVVYACPSLHEGFGFTVLEAMACGTPVVCSPETSLPEVAGDAAIYADARNSGAFADALWEVLSSHQIRSDLIRKGKLNILRFDWATTAKETLQVYERAIL